jgi:hypothetical protein
MLHTQRLKIVDSQETPIVPGETVSAEGMPLVRVLLNGKEHVRCANAEVAPFMGFSYSESLTPVIKSKVEVLVANPDTGIVELMAIPLGQISVYDAVSGEVIASATNEAGTNKVTVDDDHKGAEVRVQYRYAPSTLEVLTNDYTLMPTMSASDMTGSTGVILQGIVYTDCFDPAKDFSDITQELCVDALGLVSTQAAGGALASIPGVVVHVPTAELPFLGIRLRG